MIKQLFTFKSLVIILLVAILGVAIGLGLTTRNEVRKVQLGLYVSGVQDGRVFLMRDLIRIIDENGFANLTRPDDSILKVIKDVQD